MRPARGNTCHVLVTAPPTLRAQDPRYVTDFTCTGGDAARLEDARLSFPSGHASMAAYSSGFTLLYLGHRVRSRSWASVVLLNQVSWPLGGVL